MGEPPKPKGPPELTVSAEGPKVGWTYILLEKPDGKLANVEIATIPMVKDPWKQLNPPK